jgi:AcrR family transcriptional regulator
MAAPKTGTRERILDAAEHLFATKGFEGASTREIVAKSGDTIGSVNYHFGSKQILLDEVVARRWYVVDDARKQEYKLACDRNGGPAPIGDVVTAIVIPYLKMAMLGGDGWRSYMMLQSRLFYSPDAYDDTLRTLSEPVARELIGWMRAALPYASDENLGYAYQFMIGSTVQSAAEIGLDRINRITDGACSSKNFEAISVRLTRFITAGVENVCAMKSDISIPSAHD